MWRSYAGTFTAKRKTSASAHSYNSSDSAHQQHINSKEPLQHRRSSSISSSLEDLIQRGEERRRDSGRAQEVEDKEQQKGGDEGTAQGEEEGDRATEDLTKRIAEGSGQLRPSQTAAQHQRSNSMPPVMPDSTAEGMDQINSNANFATHNTNNVLFERDARSDRPAPEMPTTEGIEYPRAASWSSSTVAEIMRDSIGRQVFRCFLHESLAEENLLFVEEVEKLKKEKQRDRIRLGVQQLLDKYGPYINLSSVAMSKLREATKSDTPDPKSLDTAHKEVYKLLENDQFPRFRRSKLYLGFLEQLLPRSYAERWTTSFDALLGNQVGRHHFRQFLFSVHAEENLRFWESVIEFRQLKNKSTAMLNMGRTIQQQFLREGAHNEVFLPFGLRQRVEKKIREKDVDETLFDDAVKHVEQILKNDPYVRFLQSKDYNDLLAKLH